VEATLYTTLEPCLMCDEALTLMHADVERQPEQAWLQAMLPGFAYR
jgi:hypothetical protein